mgnify:CR=1 FL=1
MSVTIPVYNNMSYRTGSGMPADAGANLLPLQGPGGIANGVGLWLTNPTDAGATPNWENFDAYLETLDPTLPFIPDHELWIEHACEILESDPAIRTKYRNWIGLFYEKLHRRHPNYAPKKDGSNVATGMFGFTTGTYPTVDTDAAKAIWRNRQLELGLSTTGAYPRGVFEKVSVINPNLYISNSNRTQMTDIVVNNLKIAREASGGKPVWTYFSPRYNISGYTDVSLRGHFLREDDFSYYFQLVAELSDAIVMWDWDGYGDSEANTWERYPATYGDPAAAYNSSYPAGWGVGALYGDPDYPEDNWAWLIRLKELMGVS